jgi:hypothetical protein
MEEAKNAYRILIWKFYLRSQFKKSRVRLNGDINADGNVLLFRM